MADEVLNTAQADEVPVVDVPDVPQPERTPVVTAVAAKVPPPVLESDEEPKVLQSGSYKEECTRVADLVDYEKKAVEELKVLVREALGKHEFFGSVIPQQQQEPKDESAKEEPKLEEAETKEESINQQSPEAAKEPSEAKADANKVEISIWGIPLLSDERSDVILLKFLRTRDFKVKEAFNMLQNTIRWRKQFGIDELVEQDLGDDLQKVVFMHGFDKQGHPEARFQPGGICTIVQIMTSRIHLDFLSGSLDKLQTSPSIAAGQLPRIRCQTVNKMISPLLTQRTRSKFVFAGPSKTAETLFRYIAAEQVQAKYGGLSKDGEFTHTDSVIEETIKPAAKHTVEFPACFMTWDVNYGAEFVPSGEDSYTIIIQKTKKVDCSDEQQVVCNNFKAGELGKVVLTIDSPTSKKKKLLYRLKTMTTSV
ncbi:defensin-like protein 6-like [Hibiscus syriacus]|uniref:Defensin-like protein 6-like n=1 Tax=Hibiscus syriacus TaxID=106335 RepID=A0A6A3BPJ8_HIBSY|nr:defensin-like protein 6-like [Hibiscus syriacus]